MATKKDKEEAQDRERFLEEFEQDIARRLADLDRQIEKAIDLRDWERAGDLARARNYTRDYLRARDYILEGGEEENGE